MKILLIGEYSNVHNTLAQGLRHLGHEVMVASNGDGWKNYPRDINLGRIIERKAGLMVKVRNAVHLVQFLARLLLALPRMRGYDVVQVINPDFIELKASRTPWLYRYLRRNNKRVVLGAYGDDYYLVDCMTKKKPLRYSDYNRGEVEIFNEDSNKRRAEWFGTSKERMSRFIASDCDAIVAGAYEYWLPYSLSEDRDARQRLLRDKLHLVPFPVVMPSRASSHPADKLRVFIGISKGRSVFKGTDIMLRVAEDLLAKYPDKMELLKAEGVPFDVYKTMMDSSDVLLDQIYAYGPGMNALLAMSKGMIVFSGGEPEHYDSMGEVDCRPIINTLPSYDYIYEKLEWLVLHPETVELLKRQSREYVERNHEYMKVARRMEAIYASLLK
jgi:hypothetical protein